VKCYERPNNTIYHTHLTNPIESVLSSGPIDMTDDRNMLPWLCIVREHR